MLVKTPRGSAGIRTQLGDAALGKHRDKIPKPNNSQGCRTTRIPGFSNHLDLQVTSHTQNEVAGIAHVLLAGLTLHTEREGRFMHCIPAWSVETAKIIQIYFSPSNDFNRLLNKTSNPSLQHAEETNPLFSSWQNEMKSRSKASSLCNLLTSSFIRVERSFFAASTMASVCLLLQESCTAL